MSPHAPSSIAQRGFTLLEVLVALAVFAVFSTLAYAGLMRIIEGRDRVEAERERWRALTLAFAQMEDDLAQALPRSVRDSTGLNPLPAFAGQPVDPRPLGDPSIEFTRGGMMLPKDGIASDLRRVGYRLRDGNVLRVVWPTLDRPISNEPRETLLFANADNLTVRFHTPNGSWSDRWPTSDDKTSMPDAVEFAVDITGVGRITRIFPVGQ